MTQQEFVSFLSRRKWGKEQAARLYETALIDGLSSLQDWRESLVGVFCARNTNIGALTHLAQSLDKDFPQWEDLTKPNLSEYRDWLLAHLARNTASTYLHQLAAVMEVHDDKIPAANFRSVMAVKKEPSQHVALTEEEVERIHRYQPRNGIEADIKRAFMLECLCGARSCDIANITAANIKDGWLTYVSQKTKTETSVPVHRDLMHYLTMPVHNAEYYRSTVCRTLKSICKKCGISDMVKLFTKGQWVSVPKYELVGSHTARRSFATQLALRNVPIATIAKLMGHADAKMTSRYICIDSRDIGDTAMSFFN